MHCGTVAKLLFDDCCSQFWAAKSEANRLATRLEKASQVLCSVFTNTIHMIHMNAIASMEASHDIS